MIDWTSRVANPEAMGESEKKLWQEVQPKIEALLEELKQNGRIENVYVAIETDHLVSVMEKLDRASSVNNFVLHVHDNYERAKTFLHENQKFGMDEQIFLTVFLQAGLLVDMFSTELFKLLILFHLKNVSHDGARFSQTMNESAPNAWKLLRPYVDNDFRNAIAHGAFSVRNKKIVIYRDAKLVPSDEMELADFMIRLKRQNVLYHCLVCVLVDLKKRRWFA
jgi:hypothetical protein